MANTRARADNFAGTSSTVSPSACLVVDLADVTFLDSTGIAALIIAHRRAVAAGQTLTVVNAQGGVRRVLDITVALPSLTSPAAIHLNDDQPGAGTSCAPSA